MATEECLQLSSEEYLRFLEYKNLIVKQHDVTINAPDVELSSNDSLLSDIFFVEFSGSEGNVRSAIETVMKVVTQGKKKVSFPKELQCVFEDSSWLQVFNKVHKVVCETKKEKLCISGTNLAVEQAVSAVKDLISTFIVNCDQPHPKRQRHNTDITLPKNLSLPFSMQVSFANIQDLPFAVKKMLLSLLKKAYDYQERNATESVTITDNPAERSVVLIDDEPEQLIISLDSSVEINKSLESSVIVLENPPNDIPVIILSDDETEIENVNSSTNVCEPKPDIDSSCKTKEEGNNWNCRTQESHNGNSKDEVIMRKRKFPHNEENELLCDPEAFMLRKKKRVKFCKKKKSEEPNTEASQAATFIPLEKTKPVGTCSTIQSRKNLQKKKFFPRRKQQQQSSTLSVEFHPVPSVKPPLHSVVPPLSSSVQTSSSNVSASQSNVPNSSVTRVLRPVVIDGSNVAMTHGKAKNVFSCKGIEICIEYFLSRGHTNVVAFVPQMRRHRRFDTIDQDILERLAEKQQVVFTPSRRINGVCINSYDDRFIVKLAHTNGGVIVSNDNYRDIMLENADWKATIQNRLLMYCFVGDIFMIPDDPLGKDGPCLDDFLSFPASQTPPTSSSSK